jgi:hypothetical protein
MRKSTYNFHASMLLGAALCCPAAHAQTGNDASTPAAQQDGAAAQPLAAAAPGSAPQEHATGSDAAVQWAASALTMAVADEPVVALNAPEPKRASLPGAWVAVGSATLERARGGFSTPNGLEISLGIERLVSINGDIVAHTAFQIADIGNLTSDEAAQTSQALSSLKLVQNGSDNIYLANLSPQIMNGTVIQNSLDNQLIRSETVISASVNSMGLLKTLNFQGSLNAALANALGAR